MQKQARWILGGLVAGAFAGALPATADITPHGGMLRYPDVSKDQIVFVYGGDLWLVARTGGVARPLASPPGEESFPRFSADGGTIAFVGNYDGDRDLYTLATAGGVPFRVTHHPMDERLCDWTPGGDLLFVGRGIGGLPRQSQLLTVAADGGLPEQLPVPYGAAGAISPDRKWLCYTPHNRDGRTWKRYRGGMASDLWLFNLETLESRQITDWEGTDTQPMWVGQTVYYLSDAGPNHRLNIWSYDTGSGDRRQVTRFSDYDVQWPALGPGPDGKGEIVLQNGTGLHLLSLPDGKLTPVKVTIPGARPTLRPQKVEYDDFINGGSISSTGKRVAIEARGEVWSVPAEKGITRNLTRTSGTAERSPAWSPDGKWIAYLSDATGEYEVYVTRSDGRGETRQVTDNGTCFRRLQSWSPDSKQICFTDKTGSIFLVEVESGAVTEVARDPWGREPGVSWSADSKWLTFALSTREASRGQICLYDVAEGALHRVTSPFFSSSSPTFDRKGEFLYFASQRSFRPTYSEIEQNFVYRDTEVLLAVPLNADVEHPWLPENEEEEWDDADGDDEDKDGDDDEGDDEEGDDEDGDDADKDKDKQDKDADSDDEDADVERNELHGVWKGTLTGLAALGMPEDEAGVTMSFVDRGDDGMIGTIEVAGSSGDFDSVEFSDGKVSMQRTTEEGMTFKLEATIDGDTLKGTWSNADMGLTGTFELTRTDEEPEDEEGDDEVKPVVIDLEGFERRALPLPVDNGSFGNLVVNDKNQLLYMRYGESRAIKLFDIDEHDKGERNVLAGAFGFDISADGKKLLALTGEKIVVVSAAAGQSASDPVDTGRMVGYVNPREEWAQVFHEAWRLQRDYFYDPGMHGVDWDAVRERYAAQLPDCVSRSDVAVLIREMIAELNVGHAYYRSGPGEPQPRESVGMLGCDFALVESPDGTAYQITTVYEGAAWDSDARGPLSQPGVEVREGDYLLAVNGIPVDTDRDPWAAFIGLADETVELTVNSAPNMEGDDLRRVLVKTLSSDGNLRFRHWIERNRAYVEEKSGGKIGYIYVQNTGVPGQNDLIRQFYGQSHMPALLIDERWNGGGQIPHRFIELLDRPVTNYWALRDGQSWTSPGDAHNGPKAMLINGMAGSGGDMFPKLFRQHRLGKLIGTRTWGGLVGISGNPGLIDGAGVTVPRFAYYDVDGSWGVEGHGVDPDIEVIDDPANMQDGADPQLDAAIAHLLDELKRHPYRPTPKPSGPDRAGMGIAEEDK